MACPLDLIVGGVRLEQLASPCHTEEKSLSEVQGMEKALPRSGDRGTKHKSKKSFEFLEEATPDLNDLN